MSSTIKPIKAIVLGIAVFFFIPDTHAQLLKKLKKRAERSIERKLEEKVDKETDKAFDSTFNKPQESKKQKQPNSPISLNSNTKPESVYNFSHKYTMLVDDGKNQNNLAYYLTNDADYIGMSVPNESMNMINVMDINKKTMFMFMDNNGMKNLMSVNLDIEEIADEAAEDSNYSIKPTGNTKKILGYLAKEFEVKSDEMYGTIWITEDAGVSFSKGFYNQKNKKGMDNSWMKYVDEDGLFLEMTMTDTSKKKPKTMTMKCVSLEKSNFSIETSGYKRMM